MHVIFAFFIIVAGLVFTLLLLVGPIWLVFYYVDRWKRMNAATARGLTSEEADTLREVAEKLEARVQSLEKLLDEQAVGWRDQ